MYMRDATLRERQQFQKAVSARDTKKVSALLGNTSIYWGDVTEHFSRESLGWLGDLTEVLDRP
jgi:hypothetical protein